MKSKTQILYPALFKHRGSINYFLNLKFRYEQEL